MDDLYTVLNTSPQADGPAIQLAYRRLAFRYHPDRNPERYAWAEEQMKRLNAAYYVLSHPMRRESYDSQRSRGGQYYAAASPGTSASMRHERAAYPLETENDWHNLHTYAAGTSLPDEEAADEQRMAEYMREFVRLSTPRVGKPSLGELLLSAATSQFTVYSPYARLVAKITLRTTLATLKARAPENTLTARALRQIIGEVNDCVQGRMATERLRMVEKNKNIIADWSGMLLTIVDFMWGEAA